jgi:hypothetical protein
MNLRTLSNLLWFLLPLGLNAQTDTISKRIVLIGDGGSLTNGRHPVKDAVRKLIPMDERTTVLFLGDNIYPAGLQDEELYNYDDGKAALDSQLAIADGTPAKIFLIPGNHDWDDGKRSGWEGVIREQLYVDFFSGKPNAQFLPKDGCPGPVEVNLGNDVTMILFDSQWWIHPFDKPTIESDCDCKTKEEILTQLEDIIARNSKKFVIFACHHPFRSNGIHGGYYTLKQHIFPFTDAIKKLYLPLPILGSVYPIARSVFGTPQDLPHPNYTNMVNEISKVAKAHRNLVFVAGHEHNLQLIQDSSFSYIVSGGGCKTGRVSKSKRAPYVAQETGFVVLEISTNKNVRTSYYTVAPGATIDADSVKMSFTTNILNFSTLPDPTPDSNTVKRDVSPVVKYNDTISISASEKYPPVHGLKKFMLGQSYRHEWSTPVNMKVFNVVKEGYTILSMGGGKQTKSLRLRDKNGKEWTLRAVDKNPTQALPENFRGTLAQDVVQEFNSAAHPYAPMTIYPMAKATNVVAPNPQLYFVPDDPALGFYQPIFANTVCLLEQRDPSLDGSDTKSTAKVFNKLIEENDHRADQPAVLRARLLDILIGDFDRHFDQWKWATSDTGKGKLYYPIPRDRDQAYFYSNGRLLKAASKNLLPFLKGFDKQITEVEWLGFSAKDFDRLFLTDLDAEEWKKTIAEFKSNLTDTVITEAIQKLPREVYGINGPTIIEKLKSRRDNLDRPAMKYYRFISRQVNVVGSNQQEYFRVSNHGEGLQVRVYARENGVDTGFIMYDRIFEPSNTYEIRLYGLNGNDLFQVDDSARSRIKLRIIGGKGNDTFDISGHTRNLLYDIKAEGNYIKRMNRGSKNRFSKDPPVNQYSIIGFKYNKTRFPQTEFGINSDDGLVAGAAVSRRTHGFRNEPYATDQRFSAMYSVTRGSYRFNYLGEFNHFTRSIDLVLKGELGYHTLTNFFGLGNTVRLPDNPDYGFYRNRFSTLELQAFLRRRYFENLQLMIGPYMLHYWNKPKDDIHRILEPPLPSNLDSADVFSKKTWLGFKAAMNFDNRNSDIFPTRGVLWKNDFVYTLGIGSTADNFSKFSSDMTIYASLSDPARLVAVLGMGGTKIFNSSFEYFQGAALGNSINLHGFRRNRYVGQSSLYGSLELRYKLFEVKSYFLPGPFGITGFYDAGRVWLKHESSKVWHQAFGGGVYFIPFNLFMVSASVGFSGGTEEKIFNFTLGSKINFSF